MAKKTLTERLRDRQKQIKDSSGSYKYVTIKEGTTRIRILPVGDENEFGMEIAFIFLNKTLGGLVSPSTFGEKCALTNAYEELSNSKKSSDRKFAEKLKAKRKFAIPAAVYKDADGGELMFKEPKLVLVTPGIFNEMIEFFLDTKDGGDFTDPGPNGFDLKIKRTGKGMTDTEYSLRPCKPSRLPKGFPRDEVNLETMVREITPSYKETKRLLEQFLNIGDDDDETKEEKRPLKKKKRSRDL